MITLGINAAFHDPAATLVRDGRVLAASEEERFTRVKHGKRPLPFTVWELPFHAIDDCLRQAGLRLSDVDHIAYSLEPTRFRPLLAIERSVVLPLEPGGEPPEDEITGGPWDALVAAYVVNAPAQLADGPPLHLRERLDVTEPGHVRARWRFVDHHRAHQASACMPAPFERSAVMTLDGRGERATTTYGAWRPDGDGRHAYVPLGEVAVPHSLGLLYERITTHLGFLHSSDEYKVMALAAMGAPTDRGALGELVRLGDDGQYTIDPFDPARVFGPARRRGEPFTKRHCDIAASLQAVLEERVLAIARWLREASGERHLAMAGGVALNCVMNSRLRDAGAFDAVWVQPAAGDAGTALGAALWVDAAIRAERPDLAGSTPETFRLAPAAAGSEPAAVASPNWRMADAYLGPDFDDDAIGELLGWAGLACERHADDDSLVRAVAARLAEGAIVGWFQGRMEFGPRALGARSILASPIDPQMQARLNELKDREDFRPVAPAVTEAAFADWFEPVRAEGGGSPFMLFVERARPDRADRIPSACHSDGTARVQVVTRAGNARFHALLEAFAETTGVPILVNTSFNVRGEPIVATPRAAIEAFFSTPLDILAIGSWIVSKSPTSAPAAAR